MRIAISGIGGFLGTHLAAFFSQADEVVGISTSVSGNAVFGFDELDRIPNPDAVIHCHAAVASGTTVVDPATLIEGNIAATQKITSQFPEARHVYISSVSVYGNNTGLISEETLVDPITDYAKSKLAAERIIHQCQKSAVVRLSSLFGSGMKENTLIPNYTNQALQNNAIEVWGSGERKQNYFHISDAATLVRAIVDKDQWQQQVYLGTSGREYSNLEIAQLIASETGASIVHKNNDHALSVQYNNTFTQKNLNWHPQTQTPDAIKAYIQWKKRQF